MRCLSRNILITISLLVLSTTGVVIGLWATNKTDNATGAVNVSAAVSTTRVAPDKPFISSIQDVPKYPAGIEVDSVCIEDQRPANCRYAFRTTDTLPKIVDYYKENLLRIGWVLTSQLGDSDGKVLRFVWTNNNDNPTARCFLRVSIGESTEPGSTYVDVSFERWPDPNKVPLYPDAQQVQVRWEKDQSLKWVRITTYLTQATRSQVKAYYKAVMLQQGWWYNDYRPPDTFKFGYTHGGIERPDTGSSVSIDAQPQSGTSALTRVEITTEGDEIVSTDPSTGK